MKVVTEVAVVSAEGPQGLQDQINSEIRAWEADDDWVVGAVIPFSKESYWAAIITFERVVPDES